LELAGHSVSRFATAERLRIAAQFHDVVVFDLTAEGIDGPDVLHSLREHGEVEEGTPTLGYYSHVDTEMRARALEAGFTRVVPRSRMARETVALVEGLLD
jgi:CheY-like chemotaxis protein